MKTLRVTLADVLGPSGPTGRVTGEVWARFVDGNGAPREVRYTDGTLVTIAAPRVVLNASGYADFNVVANDDALVHVDDQGFGIQVGWDLTYRGAHGQKVPLTSAGRTVIVTSSSPTVAQFGLLATATPVIAGTSYITQGNGDARYHLKGAVEVLVRDSGATGSGSTLDQGLINTCITNNPGRDIRFTNGPLGVSVYLIDATANTGAGSQPVGIKLNQPGTRLILDPGVQIKVQANSSTSYSAVQVTAADCAIEGGVIMGDLGSHTGSTGEWGHCVDINAGAHRFRLEGTKTTKAWGDGIIIMGAPQDVRINDAVSDDNRRQGMSITNAVRPQVLGGRYMNTGLTAFTGPGAGIDIEPNAGVGNVTDVLISGVTFAGNRGPAVLASSNGQTLTGLVVGCRSDGDGVGTTKTHAFYAIGATNKLRYGDCHAANSGLDGFNFDSTTSGIAGASCTAEGSGRHGFGIFGDNSVLTAPMASTSQQSGIYIDAAADGTGITGGKSTANSQLANGTYQNVDNNGTNGTVVGHISDAGTLANKPNYGYTNRTGASGNRFLDCTPMGTFVGGAFLDQAGNAYVSPAIGVSAGVPTAAAGANNGTSPPAPVVAATSRNHRGNVTFGSGTSPAAGAQCVVTYSAAYQNAPFVQVVARNTATQALGPYISSTGTGSFTLSTTTAPTASQANTVYAFDFIVIG